MDKKTVNCSLVSQQLVEVVYDGLFLLSLVEFSYFLSQYSDHIEQKI
jgi:hypothetical protein